MPNAPVPSASELPTSRELIRSTIIAIVIAAVVLVTVVLPAEYAIDPTGIGSKLGLTRMGEIKVALRNEAAADRAAKEESARLAAAASGTSSQPGPDAPSAASTDSVPAPFENVADFEEVLVMLDPGQERQFALDMKSRAKVEYDWFTDWGPVAFEMHGVAPNAPKSPRTYAKSDSGAADQGVLEAEFEGTHGWTWRNTGKEAVTVTLRVRGEYRNLREIGG